MARRSVPGLLFGLLWLGLVATIAAPPLLAIATVPAFAQEEVRRGGGILQFLFGRRERAPAEPVAPRATKRRSSSGSASTRSGGRATAPAEPKAEVVEKLPDARTILVVGDFLASGLAEGLEQAFAERPGIRIVSRANGSSGFVRDDYYNWPVEIGAIIEEEKPVVALVMIGSNDRQEIALEGGREAVRSDAWLKEYEARATRFAETIRQSGVPLLWVGMPSFKASSMSADMVAFNDVFRTVAEGAGGEFIDIWDGFVDENGAFSATGPDINGQRVRLRGSDGINLTRAGKRKVAFYAERPLNRLLGETTPGIASLGPTGPRAAPGINPAEIERTQPIALGDPALDGATGLMGAPAEPKQENASMPIEQLVQKGIAPAGRPGRADDFSSGPAVIVTPGPASTETTATIPGAGPAGASREQR